MSTRSQSYRCIVQEGESISFKFGNSDILAAEQKEQLAKLVLLRKGT